TCPRTSRVVRRLGSARRRRRDARGTDERKPGRNASANVRFPGGGSRLLCELRDAIRKRPKRGRSERCERERELTQVRIASISLPFGAAGDDRTETLGATEALRMNGRQVGRE